MNVFSNNIADVGVKQLLIQQIIQGTECLFTVQVTFKNTTSNSSTQITNTTQIDAETQSNQESAPSESSFKFPGTTLKNEKKKKIDKKPALLEIDGMDNAGNLKFTFSK